MSATAKVDSAANYNVALRVLVDSKTNYPSGSRFLVITRRTNLIITRLLCSLQFGGERVASRG